MAFDLKTAKPVASGGFDISTAQPVGLSEADMAEHANSLDYKMAVASGRPAETLPQYTGRNIKEMALPAIGATVGSVGGLPGQATGAMLGETLNQALNIKPSRSVIPEVDKPNLTDVGIAGAAQVAIPAIAWGARKVGDIGKAIFEPFYESGKNAIVGRTLEAASGGTPQIAEAIKAGGKELVPGSLPTVGEASGNAGLASLEKSARAISSEVKNAFQSREAAQNAARLSALAEIAGTEADKSFAEQARKQATAPLLAKLSQSHAVVDTQPTVNLIDKMIEKSAGRSKLTNVLEQVKQSLYQAPPLTENNWNGAAAFSTRTNPAQLYQGARKNIADLLAERAGDGSKVNESISRELTTVMKSLDHQIAKAEPAYKSFMSDFANMSKPINRMDVGSLIHERSVNPLTETINPTSYAKALSDKTAQQATGFKRATLEGTMTPEQMASLNAIKEDLARTVTAQRSAATRGSDTIQNLAYANLIDRAGVPTFLREFAPTQAAGNLLSRGADSIYSRANREIANRLAMTMLDPKQASSAILRATTPSRYEQIINALIKRGSPVGGALLQESYNERGQ